MIGEIVKVQHAQTMNKRGQTELRRTKPTYEKIAVVYEGGQVLVGNSLDLWDIVPSKDSKAKFETTLPEALRK